LSRGYCLPHPTTPTAPPSQTGFDASSARYLPAYARVRARLLEMIENGKWRPGNRIHSENELAPLFKVSVATIRSALAKLVEEGVLVRTQGVGTFVARTKLLTPQVRYHQFIRRPGGPIADVAIKVLSVRRVREGPAVKFLGRDPAGYVRLQRLVIIDDQHRIYSLSYLPASRFGTLASLPVEELDGVPLYAYLENRFGTPTLKNEHFMRVVRFPKAVRRLLHRPRATTGCLWEFVALSYRDIPIEYRCNYLSEMPLRLRIGFTSF